MTQRLSETQIATIVDDFRNMLIGNPPGGIRMTMFRPSVEDLSAPDDGWMHYIAGGTTYYFMTKGPVTSLERHILSSLHDKAKNGEDRCISCRHWDNQAAGDNPHHGNCRLSEHDPHSLAVFTEMVTHSNFGCNAWKAKR